MGKNSQIAPSVGTYIVKIDKMLKHPNADELSIVQVGSRQVVVRTEDYEIGDLAIYIPPGAMIPEDRSWVQTHCPHLRFKGVPARGALFPRRTRDHNGVHKLRAVRYRGVLSQGMLVPVMAHWDSLVEQGREKELCRGSISDLPGTNITEDLGIFAPGEKVVQSPSIFSRAHSYCKTVVADFLDNFRNAKGRLFPVYWMDEFREGYENAFGRDEVIVTERLEGTQAAFVWHKGKLVVSSKNKIREQDDGSIYWKVARANGLAEKLKRFPDFVFYATIVSSPSYRIPAGQTALRFFDIYDIRTKQFLPYDRTLEFFVRLGWMTVPFVYSGPMKSIRMKILSMGNSFMSFDKPYPRAGIVIRRRHGHRVVMSLRNQSF